MTGLYGASTQQQPAVPFGYTTSNNIGVLIVNRVAAVTDKSWQIIAFGYSKYDR